MIPVYSIIVQDTDIDRKALGLKWLINALQLTSSNKKPSDYKMTEEQRDNNTFFVYFTLKKGKKRK